MKKILAVVLCLLLAGSMLPVSAAALEFPETGILENVVEVVAEAEEAAEIPTADAEESSEDVPEEAEVSAADTVLDMADVSGFAVKLPAGKAVTNSETFAAGVLPVKTMAAGEKAPVLLTAGSVPTVETLVRLMKYVVGAESDMTLAEADFNGDGVADVLDVIGLAKLVAELAPPTGWVDGEDGYRYYYTEDGVMLADTWAEIDGETYFFDADGAMLTGGIWNIDGEGYYFGEDGAMHTGWLEVEDVKLYFKEDGTLTWDEWLQIDGEWYYFDSYGYVVTGWQYINGKWYFLDENGVMLHDTTVNGYHLGSSGALTDSLYGYSNGYYYYDLLFNDGTVVRVTGINLKLESKHNYYRNETTEQAVMADAVCKYYADEIMVMPELTSDLDRVMAATYIAKTYSDACTYGNDSAGHYRSPYGVFWAGVYTCAGSTRALGRILDYMGFSWTHANENQYQHQWCELYMDGYFGYADGMGGFAGYGEYGSGYDGNGMYFDGENWVPV